jgi:hypothetical protein
MDEPNKNRVWQLLGTGLDCPAVARSLGMSVTSVRDLEAKAGGVRPQTRLLSERVLSLEERGDLEGTRRGRLAEGDRDKARTVALDGLARGRPQQWPGELPGPPGRLAGLAICRASQACQAQGMPEAAAPGRAALRAAPLTAPDLPLVG